MTRRNNLTKRGFTVLEVTIAVSVIAILAGLLIYAISHLTASGKANSTRIMLQNNRGMLQEFDTAVGLSRSATFWPWIDLQTGNEIIANASPSSYPTNGAILWSSSVTYAVPSGTLPSQPLCAPSGAWTNDTVGFANRNGSYAVLYTQLAMRMIGSISAAKTMMAGIPTGSTMVPVWISGAPYAPGNVVKSPKDNNYYRCITAPASVWTGTMTEQSFLTAGTGSSSYSSDPSTDNTNWQKLGPSETPDPILLDAWGNPILMAPAAGLINIWTNCSKSAPPPGPPQFLPPEWGGTAPTTQLQAWANPLPGGGPPPSYCQPPIVAPDGKPFFYSAGPDGDFTAGDDNIYSFNK